MKRQVVAVVTGVVRNPILMEASFEPLLSLKRQGVIDHILYVTWDRNDLDAHLEPFAANAEIELVREPEPLIEGFEHYRKGFLYQQRNLATALGKIADPEALIIKLRPDFVIDPIFLAAKIAAFDFLCAPSTLAQKIGLPMPPSPFKNKIWVPWADANMPFFIEDGAYMGLHFDIAKLATPAGEDVVMKYGNAACGWVAHVARFAPPFLPSLPIFEGFLKEIGLFVRNFDFRIKMLEAVLGDPFYWHLLYANAWALATSFHIDSGYPGQMHFFPSKLANDVTRRSLDEAAVYPPYSNIESWRAGQKPGGLTPCVARVWARLVDDSWPSALFTCPEPADTTRENRRTVLVNLIEYRSGVLDEMEHEFYSTMKRLYHDNWQSRAG